MKNVLVYLSGPITPRNGYTVEDNRASAEKIFLDLIRMGIPCFCPHFTPIAEEWVDYETWIQYDFAILTRCTHMLMLPRWENSPGALRERAEAIRLGMQIFDSLEEIKEMYGETNPVNTIRTRKRTSGKNRMGTEGNNERLQQSDGEGAHSIPQGDTSGGKG